jgi:hypothetical protein
LSPKNYSKGIFFSKNHSKRFFQIFYSPNESNPLKIQSKTIQKTFKIQNPKPFSFWPSQPASPAQLSPPSSRAAQL